MVFSFTYVDLLYIYVVIILTKDIKLLIHKCTVSNTGRRRYNSVICQYCVCYCNEIMSHHVCLFILFSSFQMIDTWEETPRHYIRLDVRSLLQDAAIEDVSLK